MAFASASISFCSASGITLKSILLASRSDLFGLEFLLIVSGDSTLASTKLDTSPASSLWNTGSSSA
jgi:hypothetical protein